MSRKKLFNERVEIPTFDITSLFDIFNTPIKRPFIESDFDAIRSDWEMVGNDLKKAINKIDKEINELTDTKPQRSR